jgi:hypothetical protein
MYAESHLRRCDRKLESHFEVRDSYYGGTRKLESVVSTSGRIVESYDQAPGPRATVSQEPHGSIKSRFLQEHLKSLHDPPAQRREPNFDDDGVHPEPTPQQ